MGLSSYLKLVEIQTKLASVLPFLGGTLYASYRFGVLNRPNIFLMLGSLLCVDMGTTTLNNYMDYKRAKKRSGYGYEVHNAIVRDGLKESRVLALLAALAIAAVGLGIVLALRSSWVVLALGSLSFLLGVLYSAGPLPLSRTPLGELFSGLSMGLIIPFISIIIHSGHEPFFTLGIDAAQLEFIIQWRESLTFLLFFAPLAAGIANIMLTNNICDREDDRENGRATLPILMGLRPALVLWLLIYLAGFLAPLAAVVFGLLPWWMAFFALVIILILPKIRGFLRTQEKATTFANSVQIFTVQALALALLAGCGRVLNP